MSVDFNISARNTASTYGTANTTSAQKTDTKAEETAAAESTAATTGAASEEAAVYEKSTDSKADSVTATKKDDRSAIIAQMKADSEQRASQLLDIVRKTMEGQGKAIGTADDMWKFLAGGDFTVDPATKAQAQADIADDGYWGVDQTSDRILDFAKALAGDDPDKADQMLEAFKKGFEQATKSWGKDLPELSQRTYDSVLSKFDDWKNSKNASNTTAATAADNTANDATAQAQVISATSDTQA